MGIEVIVIAQNMCLTFSSLLSNITSYVQLIEDFMNIFTSQEFCTLDWWKKWWIVESQEFSTSSINPRRIQVSHLSLKANSTSSMSVWKWWTCSFHYLLTIFNSDLTNFGTRTFLSHAETSEENLSDTSIGVFSLFNSRNLWVDHHAFPGSVRHGTLSNSIGLTMLRMDFASERGIMGIETPNNTPDTKTHSRQCGGHGKYCICSTRRLRSTSKDRDSRHRENQSIGADPEQKLREKQPGEENNQWNLWSLISYVFHGVV